ncbi:hypothetical protein EC973_002234 [Apophysomyces ossiformis]|uniref:Proteasomal ATPase-associated factor 1 n=1 Tax=Apophysomyces ossiformis TaxID=679940 RepID=A0A8H7BWD1_9FUNG|nr:hypothetical protein EC973_002234 [Apophysomyces ossiformis]
MPIHVLPHVSVQPDWDQVVRDVSSRTVPEESFWISCYRQGEQSVHATVSVKSDKLEGQDGVQVERINSRSFRASCDALKISALTLVAPKTEIKPSDGNPVAALDVSPDGEYYAAAGGADIIIGKLIDAPKRTLRGHVTDVTTVQFFPSSQVLLSGAADFQIKIWSVLDGSNPVTLKGHTSAVTDTAIVARGRNVLSSSRDGTIRLWHCGTGASITTVAHYKYAVNKIVLGSLPGIYKHLEPAQLDEREVETGNKLILAALEDGTLRGIHLGTKEELFSVSPSEGPLTALAYNDDAEIVVTGDSKGVVTVYKCSDMSVPSLQWRRNEYGVCQLLTKLNENGELVVCVANADGSIYQTCPIIPSIAAGMVNLDVEYTGNELEKIYGMKPSGTQGMEFKKLVCAARDGKIRIY